MTFPLDPTLLGAFVLTGLALNFTPGPDMLFVLASGSRHGRAGGIRAALGIGAGSCVHTVAAATGLSALLASSAALFTVVKLAGAAYLVVIGVRSIFARGPAEAVPTLPGVAPATNVFRRAMLTNILNPKVALFFLALVPQFVSVGRGHVALQFLLLGLVFNTTGTIVNAFVGVSAAAISRRLAARPGYKRALDRATGTLFVGLGVRLALARQN
jgi:threonine/homoserine/homoserine lactone efflux protein